MTTPSGQAGDRDEIERLREENALLWRAYELSLGDPNQGQRCSTERWISESAAAHEALRDAMQHRESAGLSVWSDRRR